MPIISYTAESFPSSSIAALQGKKDLSCSWAELLWAAITVGKRNWNDVWRFGNYSRLEALVRGTMIYASLMEDKSGRIIQTENFFNMDPSEKTSISYFHGLMATKILARNLLNVPWILHFDLYKSGISHHLHNGFKPDFIGLNDNQDWVVLEAKGRSNGIDREAINKGKTQTRGLGTIVGQLPTLRVVVQSYFTKSGYFRCLIVDPEGHEENVVNVDFPMNIFFSKYYDYILKLISSFDKNPKKSIVRGTPYVTIDLQEIDISLGMNLDLYNLLERKDSVDIDFINAVYIMKEMANSHFLEQSNTFVGIDGIIVETGSAWSEKTMKMKPTDRKLSDF